MIQLRARGSIPPTLLSLPVIAIKEAISARIRAGERVLSKEFPSWPWLADDVRDALWKWQQGKCVYCERKREKKRESDVEHFRPKARITEQPGHPGY